MEQDTTKSEILQAINKFATNVEENFTEVKQDIKDIKKRVTKLETKVESIETKVKSIENKVGSLEINVGSLETKVGSLDTTTTSIRAQMVTKSYLDDKLADMYGKNITHTKQINTKVVSLANHLRDEGNLSTNSLKQVIALPPFAV
jgi:chromosome segregation ATPase